MVGRIVADVAAPCTARVVAFLLLAAIVWWGWITAASLALVAVALAAAFEVVSSLRGRPAGAFRLSLRPAAPTPQVNG